VRPGKKSGQLGEFTMIVPLKPGGAKRLREQVLPHASTEITDKVGTLHDARVVIIDDDTRLMFASVFDGDWDQYIDDFAAVASNLDALFQDTEGYPGITSPGAKDWLVKYQIEADAFYTAYPEASVQQIKKGQRVLNAWEELLDASAE
jgi:hypothetical protein